MRRVFERHASLTVPALSIALIVYGAGLVAGPSAYRAQAFEVAFAFASPTAWGLAFVVAGSAGLLRVNALTTAALLIVALAWAFALFSAAALGRAESPTGWVWPAACAVTTAVSVARKGVKGSR